MKNKRVAICLLASSAAWAGEPASIPSQIHVDDPRTVVVGERSVVSVYVAQFQDTLLVLPENEHVMKAFVADSANWVLEQDRAEGGQAHPSRYISIKVKEPLTQSTILNVVSDHDKPYTFKLVLSTEHCDSKVFVDADSQLAKQISQLPVYVPAADAERYKQQAEAAKKEQESSAASAKEQLESSQESFRSQYPGKLNFDYRWNPAQGNKLGVEQVFHDDKFTYVKAQPQETAALYEIKDGKPSLINYQFANGLYTVPKLLDRFYLAVGKTKLDVYREGR